MSLRAYQTEAIESVFTFFKNFKSGNPLVVAPTGSGKSHIIAGICSEIYRRWGTHSITILAHRKELLEQNAEKILKAWPECQLGIYSAGLKSKQVRNITIAGIQSAWKNPNVFGYQKLLIIDEAHLIPKAGNGMYRYFIDSLLSVNPKLRIVGLTATPFRLDSGLLHRGEEKMFDEICFDIDIKKLIDEKYLSPLRSKISKQSPNTDDARVRGGDFVSEDIIRIMDKDSLTQAAIIECLRYGGDRQSWLVFCSGVEHARHVSKRLNENNINSVVVTGDTPHEYRAWALKEFKKKNIKAICNCDVLTTGFDAPNVDLIVMLRPTKSPGLYIQMVGRGSRLSEGKTDCMVLDFAGNISRFGSIDAIKVKTDGAEKAKTEKEQEKNCPSCGEVLAKNVRVCPSCQFTFAVEREIKHDTKASTLEIISSYQEPDKTFPVTYFNIIKHKKQGKPDSLRINFYCGTLQLSEFLCLDHGGFAREVAIKKWREFVGTESPRSVLEAYERQSEFKKPVRLTCKKEGKFYRIKKVEWEAHQDYEKMLDDFADLNI